MANPQEVGEHYASVICHYGLCDESYVESPLLSGEIVPLDESVKATVRKDVGAFALDAALLEALHPAIELERSIASKCLSGSEGDEILNDNNGAKTWPIKVAGLGTGWRISGNRVQDVLRPRRTPTGMLHNFRLRAVLPTGVPNPDSFFNSETDATLPGVALSGLAFIIVAEYRDNQVAGVMGMQVRRVREQNNLPYLSGGVHTVAQWMKDASEAAEAIRELAVERRAEKVRKAVLTAWETDRRKH